MTSIVCKDLCKTFKQGDEIITGLDNVSITIEKGDFVGDVHRGGSVNYQRVTTTPHGNGTHTETVGHISEEDHFVSQAFDSYHFVAEVVTLTPSESINGMEIALDTYMHARKHKTEAVIVRTLPNGDFKKEAKYSGANPPYLNSEVTKQMREEGVNHLLIDLPSVDREEDGGELRAHKAFWNFNGKLRKDCTITEFIYVPNKVEDGEYMLNLQIAPFENDATPSKPVLFKVLNNIKINF